jgi:DIS3-like exonuclease 2
VRPQVDRLAFSIVWTFDADFRIRDEWAGRTVIRSCCRLDYDTAQVAASSPAGFRMRSFKHSEPGQ